MDYVAEIRQGNTLAFEEVYYKYHERFYFYVLKHTRSENLAEEVVQIAFIKAWEGREKLSMAYPIEVQLARIARSVMVDSEKDRAWYKERTSQWYALTTNYPAALLNSIK